MDKGSKILVAIILLSMAISVGLTFYKTVIHGDFELISQDTNEVDASDVPQDGGLGPTTPEEQESI